jgi:hypothetical protein
MSHYCIYIFKTLIIAKMERAKKGEAKKWRGS